MPRIDLEKTTQKIGRIALAMMVLTLALMWSGWTAAYLSWAVLAYVSLLLIVGWATCFFASGVVRLIGRIRARGMPQ